MHWRCLLALSDVGVAIAQICAFGACIVWTQLPILHTLNFAPRVLVRCYGVVVAWCVGGAFQRWTRVTKYSPFGSKMVVTFAILLLCTFPIASKNHLSMWRCMSIGRVHGVALVTSMCVWQNFPWAISLLRLKPCCVHRCSFVVWCALLAPSSGG